MTSDSSLRSPRPRSGGSAAATALVAAALASVAAPAPADAGQADAHGRPAPQASPPARDSSGLWDDARDEQGRFERIRTRHLELSSSWGGAGRCDEVVGRMCLVYAEGSDWWPEPEDERIVRGREELLDTLADLGRALPGDGWILAQRVWYLGEAGRWDEGARLARRCGGVERWWCDALLGLALHGEGRYVAAGEAFDRALAAMDPKLAREWIDAEVLLDSDGRDLYDDLDGAARDTVNDRVWPLMDPLWLVPGNDRRTEHLARRTVARLRDRARNPYGLSWGSDLEELLVRFGWEVGWEEPRDRSTSLLSLSTGVVGHQHPEGRTLVPEGDALKDPARSLPEHWLTHRERARASYAVAYAPVILPGVDQVAVFPRGETLVVVAAHALPEDTTFHAAHEHPGRSEVPLRWRSLPPRSGLILRRADGGAPAGGESQAGSGTEGVLTAEVPAGRWLASVETWAPSLRRAGRTRLGIARDTVPPDVPTLSDLLILSAVGPEGERLEEGAARALPRTWIPAGEPLAVGWEISGLGWRPEALAYRLSVRDADRGVFRRVGEFLGLVGEERPQTLTWEEAGPPDPVPVFRTVEMDLPELVPGRYLLRLEVVTSGRETLVSEREIEVRPAGPPGPGG